MILSFLRDQQLVTFAVLLLLTLFAVSSILEARSLAMLGALTAEKLRALVSLLRREGEAKVPEEKAGLERELVQRLRSVRVGFEDGKPVIARPLPAILDEWGHEIAEDGTAGLLGSSFTGIALVCTFLLIAWVLFTDVPAAIRATGNAKESAAAPMDALAEAVGKMGAKFVISSVGIVLAILHSFVHRDYVRRVMRATHRIAQTLSLEVVDLQSVQFLWANKLLLGTTSIAPAIARQEEVLATKLERLGKLEVVVKDLGSAVAASLGTLMKSALAEELSLVVADVRTLVEGIEGRLQEALQGNIQALGQQLVTALDGVRRATEAHAGTQVEALLDKFNDAITGGLSSKTENMQGVLANFQASLPQLAVNIEAMTNQMGQVLQQMREQQAENEKLVKNVNASTSESVLRLGSDFARQGSEAMTRIMAETNARIDQLVGALDAASKNSTGTTAAIKSDLDKAAGTVTQVTSHLGESLVGVGRVLEQVERTLAASSRSVTALTEGTLALKAAASGVQTAVARADDSRTHTEALLVAQQELAGRLTNTLQKAETVWPQLLKQIDAVLQNSQSTLTDSWTRLANQLQQATARYGTDVGERVEVLSDSVDRLVQELRAKRN